MIKLAAAPSPIEVFDHNTSPNKKPDPSQNANSNRNPSLDANPDPTHNAKLKQDQNVFIHVYYTIFFTCIIKISGSRNMKAYLILIYLYIIWKTSHRSEEIPLHFLLTNRTTPTKLQITTK